MTYLQNPPYADEDGNPTPLNPNYFAWKARKDMREQDTIGGAPKAVPRDR